MPFALSALPRHLACVRYISAGGHRNGKCCTPKAKKAIANSILQFQATGHAGL